MKTLFALAVLAPLVFAFIAARSISIDGFTIALWAFGVAAFVSVLGLIVWLLP